MRVDKRIIKSSMFCFAGLEENECGNGVKPRQHSCEKIMQDRSRRNRTEQQTNAMPIPLPEKQITRSYSSGI